MSEIEWMTRHLQRAVLWARPDGWQGRARRNAWASMVDASRRRAARLDADRSVRAALASPAAEHGTAAVPVGFRSGC
jgi:hypothetical protein